MEAKESCPVCKHASRESLEMQVLLGQVSFQDAAEKLDTDLPALWHHMKYHLDDKEEEALSEASYTREQRIKILDKCLNQLYKKARMLFLLPPESQTIKSLTILVQQLRGLARDVAILEGDVEIGTKVTIQQLNVEMTKIQSWLVEHLCYNCKKLFVGHMEEELPVVR